MARLSPFVQDGRWRLHNPLRTLPQVPVAPGLVAVLAVLLGSTAYDSFSASPFWQEKSISVLQGSATLLGFCLVVGGLFVAAASATGGVTREQRRAMPGLLAHSLVPIVVGYVFAHYLTYLVEKGQGSDVRRWLGQGARHLLLPVRAPLDARGAQGDLRRRGPRAGGRRRARQGLALLPRAHRLSGQLAMLVLMVAYTFTGLYLLFSV